MYNTAEEFSTGKSYASGELTMYQGNLYRFIASHSAGEWNDAQAEPVDPQLMNEIDAIITITNEVIHSIEYAASIVNAVSLIAGTRYKYVITNARDPR